MPASVTPQSADAPWTVGRILDWTAQHLKKHGSENARLEAEILLAHARKCPRIQLYVQAQNLTNQANYLGYSGTLTSPFFGRPTTVSGMRKVDAGIAMNF